MHWTDKNYRIYLCIISEGTSFQYENVRYIQYIQGQPSNVSQASDF